MKSANDAIVYEQQQSPGTSDTSHAILVLAVDTANATARWAHIGDTRLYCFRRGKRIIAQTRDHSVVQSMVVAGYIEQRNLRTAPRRNALFAALGDAQAFSPSIEMTPFPVRDGDVFCFAPMAFGSTLMRL